MPIMSSSCPCPPYHRRSSPAAEVDITGRARASRGSGECMVEEASTRSPATTAAILASSKLSRRRRGLLLAERTGVVANAQSPTAARRDRRQTRACVKVEEQQHSTFSVPSGLYFSHPFTPLPLGTVAGD
jgi:hypothetical protein